MAEKLQPGVLDPFIKLIKSAKKTGAPEIGNLVKNQLKSYLEQSYFEEGQKNTEPYLWYRFLCDLNDIFATKDLQRFTAIRKNERLDKVVKRIETNLLERWGHTNPRNLEVAHIAYLYVQTCNKTEFGDPARGIDWAYLGKPFEDVFGFSMPLTTEEANELLDVHRRRMIEVKKNVPDREQPILINSSTSINDLHYSKCLIKKVLGREVEQEILRNFMETEREFQWLQLAGAGGQGKSRLAFDLINEYEPTWYAGFLREDEFSRFQNHWLKWHPKKPTLIVIDYVLGHESEVKNIIQTLANRERDFTIPIRLLLVERHRWDQGELINHSHLKLGEEQELQFSSINGNAEWFLKLCNRPYDGGDEVLSRTKFEDGVVELKALNSDDLVKIARSIAIYEGSVTTIDDKFIKEHLARIDHSGRPLFAYFLGLAIGSGNFKQDWNFNDLLNSVLIRDRDSRWKKFLNAPHPFLGEDTPAMRLAVLATMIGGIDIKSVNWPQNWTKATSNDRQMALALVDGHIGNDISLTRVIPGLEPDILGEWFVLSCLAGDIELNAISQLAWETKSNKMAAFLDRCVQDFGQNIITQKLVSMIADEYSWVIHRLGHQHLPIKRISPHGSHMTMSTNGETIWSIEEFGAAENETYENTMATERALFWYTKAGEMDYAPSLFNLAYLYWHGSGVECDQARAIELFHKSATLGLPQSMEVLAYFYEHGVFFDVDNEQAFYWYELAVNCNQIEATYRLGMFYTQGIGCEINTEKANQLLNSAALKGHVDAHLILGLHLLHGTGIVQDTEKAIVHFYIAAKNGSSTALVELGSCHHEGAGVEKNLLKGTAFYRLAAQRGNEQAEISLGLCYRDGLGVKQNQRRAHWYFDWCDRFHNREIAGIGLLLSSDCFAKGIGFTREVDHKNAFDRLYRSARAGNETAQQLLGLSDFSDRSYSNYDKNFGGKYYNDEGYVLLRRSASTSNARSLFTVGTLYEHGIFYTQNLTISTSWYLLSAKKGDLLAMHKLARCYLEGTGVDANLRKAKYWVLKAMKIRMADQEKEALRNLLFEIKAREPSFFQSILQNLNRLTGRS